MPRDQWPPVTRTGHHNGPTGLTHLLPFVEPASLPANGVAQNGLTVALADGSVRPFGGTVSLATRQSACNPADGLTLGGDL